MAVAVLDPWSGQTAGSPSGSSLTISAGSGRMLWLVYMSEVGAFTYTSLTCGGVAPTGELIDTNLDVPNQKVWSWYWDEAAIASFSGSAILLVKTGTPTKHDWDYQTWSGATGGAEFGTTVSELSAANTSISTTTPSSVNDAIAVAVNRSSPNRNITDFDNLTQAWQFNTDYTLAIAGGPGGDDDVAITGDGTAGDWMTQLLHVKQSASGSPAITMKHLHESMLNG